jgi:ABC-type transporter Mla maintaining outer membrane lipid asymmetry permease subunit MlaE
VVSAIEPIDLVAFSLKTLIGGLGVFAIACHHGMSVGRSATQVPVEVSRASLNAFVFLIVFHAVISLMVIFYSDAGNLLGAVL